jgi:hypothetical protein
MKYLKKNFPIFLLSGSLIFVGVTSINQAEAATATIASLQKEIRSLKSCTNDAFGQISLALNPKSGWYFPPIRCN